LETATSSLSPPGSVNDRLNAAFDRCMQAHGAPHINTGGGEWTYGQDSAAAAACKGDLAAINAYVSSPEYRATDAISNKLLKQFWTCVGASKPDTTRLRACAEKASYPD
jgi:hypothetical protein